jgi:SpoVK/Ycf46/Vps4 family AAA+-type ATPase
VDGLSQQTDSFSQQTKPLVFILAASCKPNDIEQAMRRPGRLDKEIELTVPTVHDRSEILRTILRTTGDLKLDANSEEIGVSESSIAEVARKAHGMVASDILLVCKEAHMNALDRNLSSSIHISQNSTDMTDLEQSFDRLAVAGSSPRYIEPDDSRMLRACCGPLIDEDLLTAVDRIVPSAIREVAVDIAEVRWNDIGGMDSVKQSLKEVTNYISCLKIIVMYLT